MTTVVVFDPAMCCSTGICGPSVDPQLARFSADLDWLKSRGVSVERFNLAQQPSAFVSDETVRTALETKGEAGLPLVKVDGRVKSSGSYPSREELAGWTGIVPTVADTTAGTRAAKTASPAKRVTLGVAQPEPCCSPAEPEPSAPKSSGCC